MAFCLAVCLFPPNNLSNALGALCTIVGANAAIKKRDLTIIAFSEHGVKYHAFIDHLRILTGVPQVKHEMGYFYALLAGKGDR
jgi:hypothetical protein